MKHIVLASLALIIFLAAATRADTQRRAGATYTWDPRDWHWDKTKLDSPAAPAGGFELLVKQLTYPAWLRYRRVQGSGVALISIDASGRVGNISFSPRMAPELEQIVVTAVRRTRFLSARRAGKSVASIARFPVTFVTPR
jgi:TonB family protein